ncbi:MAG TPA: ATP-binding protein [Candidatus Limnocylindrales bacterium]|nr:ATP-binding protein [Candidatus Limnocylindrales bacterium]
MNKRWYSTIRVRLTVHYAMALLVAGAILIALLYGYLAHTFDGQLVAQRHNGFERTPAELAEIRDHILSAMLTVSLVSLGVVAVAAAGIGWWMAGRALRPLHQITATARRVADRNLHERIALDGPNDEIKDLADTFDGMLERLDRSFDGQRRFVANASHELRTPLTLNRTLIEVTLDDPDAPAQTRQLGTTLLAINQRHERLIDGLLTLASSEQALSVREWVDLAEVVRHVLASIDARVETNLRPALVSGDPVLLERLVTNLLDNAVRYNLPESGQVGVRTRMVNGNAELIVDNTGPVIAAYDIPGLFEPFRRLPDTERQAGQGTGLGLSIVKAVAQAHHGDVTAAPREGGGLSVTVRLAG